MAPRRGWMRGRREWAVKLAQGRRERLERSGWAVAVWRRNVGSLSAGQSRWRAVAGGGGVQRAGGDASMWWVVRLAAALEKRSLPRTQDQ